MSVLSKHLRPPSTASDDAVRRYVEEVRRHADPDPFFRRRLRGTVVNRFVAAQVGVLVPRARHASRMGTLGRACLYASFAMAVTVGGAMAASERAVPGELLYPLKRSIESLRLDVLPEQYHDELVAEALSARIVELSMLLESGEAALAASLTDDIHDGFEQLVALSEGTDAPHGLLRAHLDQLEALLARLPEAARAAVEHAMAGVLPVNAAPGLGAGPERGSSGRAGGGGELDGSIGAGAPAGGRGTDGATEPDRTPKPQPTPKPERTPKPEPTPKASATSESQPTPEPEPEPEPAPEPEPEPDEPPGADGT
jgi:hypothetical protein